MPQRIGRTLFSGAIAGALAAVIVLVLLTPMLLGKATAIPLDDGTARVDPIFEFSGFTLELPRLLEVGDVVIFETEWALSSLWMYTFWSAVAFGIAGLIVAAITRFIPGAVDPEVQPRSKGWTVALSGAAIGIVVGIVAAQGSATWLGEAGLTIQISVLRFVMVAVVAGSIEGGVVATTTHLISRPDVIGFEEGAWETRGQFWAAVRRALSTPVIALIALLVVVLPFGYVLLEAGGGVATLVLAGVVAAGILAVASLAAYRPGRR